MKPVECILPLPILFSIVSKKLIKSVRTVIPSFLVILLMNTFEVKARYTLKIRGIVLDGLFTAWMVFFRVSGWGRPETNNYNRFTHFHFSLLKKKFGGLQTDFKVFSSDSIQVMIACFSKTDLVLSPIMIVGFPFQFSWDFSAIKTKW